MLEKRNNIWRMTEHFKNIEHQPDMVVGNHFNSYDHYMYINDFTCTIVECIYTTKKKITSENGKIIMDSQA